MLMILPPDDRLMARGLLTSGNSLVNQCPGGVGVNVPEKLPVNVPATGVGPGGGVGFGGPGGGVGGTGGGTGGTGAGLGAGCWGVVGFLSHASPVIAKSDG